MGCSACNKMSVSASKVRSIIKQTIAVSVEDCQYTQEILEDWLSLLTCVKANSYFDLFNIASSKINSFIGTVKSAIRYSTNPCYFKLTLDEIKPLIDKIKTTNRC